jgi:flagellar biogenesis protein FliO
MTSRRLGSLAAACALALLAAPALAEPPPPSRPGSTPEPEPPAAVVAPAAPAPAPTPAPAPVAAAPAGARSPGFDPLAAGGLRLLLGSLGVVALVLIGSRLLRRLPVARLLGGAEGPIRIAATAPLGAKARLCLLEVAGTTMLIAVSPQGVQPVHVWPQGAAVPAGPRSVPSPEPRGPEAAALPGQLEGLATRLRGVR